MYSHKTEIYMIRHGESARQLERDIVCGHSEDVGMTPTGLAQSLFLGGRIYESDIVPDQVYASEAVRSRQTCRLSLGVMGCTIEPVVDKRLNEGSKGEWEGKIRDEVYTPEVRRRMRRNLANFRHGGGHSQKDVERQMWDFLESRSLEAPPKDGEPIRIFAYTHRGPIAAVVGSLWGWSPRRIYNEDILNASASLVVLEDGEWRAVYVGEMEPRAEMAYTRMDEAS